MHDSPVGSRFARLVTRVRVPFSFAVVALFLWLDWRRGVRPHRITWFGAAPDPVGLVGCAVALAGVAIRAWAAGTIVKAKKVSREGPYALVRHPLYLGSLLIAFGFCLVIGDPINFAVILVLAGCLYGPKVRAEEGEMRAKFGGEYDDYSRDVPAVIPWKLPGSITHAWQWEIYSRHREYRAGLTALAALALLEIYTLYIM